MLSCHLFGDAFCHFLINGCCVWEILVTRRVSGRWLQNAGVSREMRETWQVWCMHSYAKWSKPLLFMSDVVGYYMKNVGTHFAAPMTSLVLSFVSACHLLTLRLALWIKVGGRISAGWADSSGCSPLYLRLLVKCRNSRQRYRYMKTE